jgi:hypothetical protein
VKSGDLPAFLARRGFHVRDKINVFYYPEMVASASTLKKAILLFDETHFMDRPSFMFGELGGGQCGTVGAASPIRQFEAAFRAEGVPVFVHPAPGGPVRGDFYEQVKADVNDPLFLTRFQEGLKSSQSFRDLQIAHGNYGQFGTHEDVVRRLISLDLSAAFGGYESPIDLFADPKLPHLDLSTPAGCAKNLIFEAMVCSAKTNFALTAGTKQGFVPLADATPYGDLLGAKYARAIKALEPAKSHIQPTDLSFAIFDELVPSERLEEMTFKEIVRHRKASEAAREEFLEHLAMIQAKQASIGIDGDYRAALQRIVKTEITPAARTFKNKLRAIDESLYGALAKGAVGYLGSSAGLSLFGDLSWERLLGLAGFAGAYVAKSAIDAMLAQRAAKRECSISYILSLEK